MNELVGCWQRTASIDEVTAATMWSVNCLGASGAWDAQAEAEATEKALERLWPHTVWLKTCSVPTRATSFFSRHAGKRLAYERWRVVDEGKIRGMRVQEGRSPWGPCLPGCGAVGWAGDRFHRAEAGIGDVRGRRCGRELSGSCARGADRGASARRSETSSGSW